VRLSRRQHSCELALRLHSARPAWWFDSMGLRQLASCCYLAFDIAMNSYRAQCRAVACPLSFTYPTRTSQSKGRCAFNLTTATRPATETAPTARPDCLSAFRIILTANLRTVGKGNGSMANAIGRGEGTFRMELVFERKVVVLEQIKISVPWG